MISCNKDEITTKPINKPDPDSTEVTIFEPIKPNKTNSTKVFVHYMPWFENKETNNGIWGMHWTMNNCNPDLIDSSGNYTIASFYHPLIDPYASSDKDVIEYHLLLMKYAGIDGVMIDWYGSYDLNDFASYILLV
jgi:hypothetical protein